MAPYRAAIIGTGGIAGAHVNAGRSLGERVELVAGVDTNAEQLNTFCDKHGIAGRYTDATAMLAEQRPDLVSIATPPGTHAALAREAL